MGSIGKDLLDRILKAERLEDWDMVVELLAIAAQIEANRIREMANKCERRSPVPIKDGCEQEALKKRLANKRRREAF